MASWLDDLGLNELEHIKDGASAFAQERPDALGYGERVWQAFRRGKEFDGQSG